MMEIEKNDITISSEKILTALKDHLFNKITILSGHYCVADDLKDLSSDGETEIFTFELGVSIHKTLKEKQVQSDMVLWVNDIGIDNEKRKKLKENYQIPTNYLNILNKNKIPVSDVRIIFESTSRNSASVLFRKAYKKNPDKYQIYKSNDPSLVRCIDNSHCEIEKDKKAYVLKSPDGSPIVMKEGSNPKCNLILGTLFRSIINTSKSDTILNIFNDIYIDRIRLGSFVGKSVYNLDVNFINFFCDEDSTYNEQF